MVQRDPGQSERCIGISLVDEVVIPGDQSPPYSEYVSMTTSESRNVLAIK